MSGLDDNKTTISPPKPAKSPEIKKSDFITDSTLLPAIEKDLQKQIELGLLKEINPTRKRVTVYPAVWNYLEYDQKEIMCKVWIHYVLLKNPEASPAYIVIVDAYTDKNLATFNKWGLDIKK